jgi:hypothetical protein
MQKVYLHSVSKILAAILLLTIRLIVQLALADSGVPQDRTEATRWKRVGHDCLMEDAEASSPAILKRDCAGKL